VLRAAALLCVVSPAVRMVRFEVLRAALRRIPARRRAGALPAARVGRSVELAARGVPGAACLAQGVVAEHMLRRRGHAAVLHIGVRKDGPALAAHAWVTAGGEVVVGAAGHEPYRPLWASAG
jgi:hypothetical protein